MHIDRLKHLARDVLPYIEPDRFGMDDWKCGTECCAAGFDAQTAYANERGFHLEDDWPAFGRLHGFQAVAAYYGISIDDAQAVFTRKGYASASALRPCVTPAMVAERVESLIASETA